MYKNKISLFIVGILFALVPGSILGEPVYTNGRTLPFSLINPANSRNIRGNYAIAGNTVLCLTELTEGYGGNCQGDNSSYLNITSNMHVSKYLDIDSDTRTWNSTSSYINIPDTYDSDQGIIWAGLFWQGRVSWDKEHVIHYARPNGSPNFTTVEVGRGTGVNNVNVAAVGGINIKLKIDAGSYNDVQANTFHTYQSSRGQTYTAYADVTSIVRSAALDVGKHVFQVANLMTMEGRENSPGAYGGWAIVVIYGENFLATKPRNISIYNGFISIGRNDDPITISGFKLPESGDVHAQMSVFSGEGEYRYGRTPYNSSSDWIKISDHQDTDYRFPPGCSSGVDLGNCNNMFDAHLTGITRDHIVDGNGTGNNLFNDQLVNNVGVEVDTFDMSDIMTEYREENPDINTIYLKTFSNNDYITPSMIAFSSELYVPPLCYDYTVQLDDFDITEDNETIRAIGQGELSINVAVKSEEGDFDLKHTNLKIKLIPDTNSSRANFSNAFYSPNTVNTLVPAIYSGGVAGPSIAIGEDADTSGGTIKRNQRYFSQFNYQTSSYQYLGRFQIDLNTTIDFGSGPVPIYKSSASGNFNRCDQEKAYNPLYGSFNVERHDSSGAPSQKYPLYTQVVGKDFDFDVVAYTNPPNFNTELALNGYTVDLELINIRPYTDENATFSCSNTTPGIIQTLTQNGDKHMFVHFNGNSRVDMSPKNIQTDKALRNAAFRIWYLVDKNNTIIKYNCPDTNNNTCFENIYNQYLRSDDTFGFCTNCSSYTNSAMGTSGCYACLRDHFAKPVCSRDNFSIRPASYRISISDTNESTHPTNTNLIIDNATPNPSQTVTTLAAGYLYRIDGNATSYIDDQTLSKGYTVAFDAHHSTDRSSLMRFNDNQACYDQNDTFWELYFRNGKIYNLYKSGNLDFSSGNLVSHNNVGHYAYSITDKDWTLVDQARYQYKTFPGTDDCIVNSASLPINSASKSGCEIRSVLSYTDSHGTPVNHTDLNLTYHPYSFGLDEVQLNLVPNTAKGYLFMNDFSNSYYQNPSTQSIDMGAVFSGPVVALGKQGTQLTNYTTSCASSDVTIDLEMGDFNGTMQAYLQHGDNASPYDSNASFTYDHIQGTHFNLPKEAFADLNVSETNSSNSTVSGPGSAQIILSTTIHKPLRSDIADGHHGLNPVKLLYKTLSVTGNNDKSKADSATDASHVHIPTGSADFNKSVIFLYGKITPKNRFYDNVQDDNKTTPLFVDAYCNKGNEICKKEYGLTTLSKGENENSSVWYWVEDRFAQPNGSNVLGSTDLDSNVASDRNVPHYLSVNGDHPTHSSIEDIPFDDYASRSDLVVSVEPNTYRPVIVKVCYHPVPWLIYAPCDPHHPDREKDFHRVRFVGKSAWAGVGSTGKVVNTKSSNEGKTRMNW